MSKFRRLGLFRKLRPALPKVSPRGTTKIAGLRSSGPKLCALLPPGFGCPLITSGSRVLNYAASRGDLDMSRVGFFGQGSGATIGVLDAVVDPRIKVLDLMDPWGDWPARMAKSTRIPENERPNFKKPEFLTKVAGMDTVLQQASQIYSPIFPGILIKGQCSPHHLMVPAEHN